MEAEYFFRNKLIDMCRHAYTHIPSSTSLFISRHYSTVPPHNVADYDHLEELAGGNSVLFAEIRAAATLTRISNYAILNCMDYVIPVEHPLERQQRLQKERRDADEWDSWQGKSCIERTFDFLLEVSASSPSYSFSNFAISLMVPGVPMRLPWFSE